MNDIPAGDRNAILRHWQDAVPNDRLAHLIRDAGRSLGHRLTPLLAEHDIPFGHWAFLRVLWDRDGLTQKELSDAVGVTEPTTFAAVKALMDKGYITRRHNPGNKRKFYVYLTPEGMALQDVLVPLAEEVNRIAVQDIPPEDIALMRETLLKMIENLAAEA
ncbi:MAG: MarR family winged helix-turn-helix transcriptional regulator [Alphaproteobacteria bacterium]